MKRRLFVAIALPEETKEAYLRQARRLAPAWLFARWTRPENLHLTACFLGDVEDGALPGLAAALGAAAAAARPFVLTPDRLELAPPGRRPPTMIWGAFAESVEYARLAGEIRRAAGPSAPGMPSEKPSRPHVTLARFASGSRPEGSGRPEQPADRPRPFVAGGFSLIESRLASSGPTYVELKGFNFTASS